MPPAAGRVAASTRAGGVNGSEAMGAQEGVAALVRWAASTYGDGVRLVEAPVAKGEGFDSAVHLLQLEGAGLPPAWRQPLVLRIKADADRTEEALDEAAIQGWVADRGFPSPRVLHVFRPGELVDTAAQVMERAPGVLVLDDVLRRPWRAPRSVALLARLHADLHGLRPDGFPRDDDLLDRRLRLTQHAAEALQDDPLRAGLDRVGAIAPRLRDAPPAVCHGDFHPLNVIVDGTAAMVIDWTDAGVGDRHGDIARTAALFELAAIAASKPAERAVLTRVGPVLRRRYLRSYRRQRPIDDHRVALWTPVHLLHGWSQARALHAGLFDRGGASDDQRTDRVPLSMVDELRHRFDRSMAAVEA